MINFHPPDGEETPRPDRIPVLPILTEVDIVFPARVSPRPEDVPDHYWRDKESWKENTINPWVALASEVLFGNATGMKLLPRDGVESAVVWRWVDACLRSYQLKVEQKLAVVAWILDSYFSAFWFEGKEPQWVLDVQAEHEADE